MIDHYLLMFIRMNSREHEYTGNNINCLLPHLHHQLLCCQVTLECSYSLLIIQRIILDKLHSSGREVTAEEVERKLLLKKRIGQVTHTTPNLQQHLLTTRLCHVITDDLLELPGGPVSVFEEVCLVSLVEQVPVLLSISLQLVSFELCDQATVLFLQQKLLLLCQLCT